MVWLLWFFALLGYYGLTTWLGALLQHAGYSVTQSVYYTTLISLAGDHRPIKRRVNAKQGFREFHAAQRTIQGYEAMNMIRKGQVRWVRSNDVGCQIRFIERLFWLAA